MSPRKRGQAYIHVLTQTFHCVDHVLSGRYTAVSQTRQRHVIYWAIQPTIRRFYELTKTFSCTKHSYTIHNTIQYTCLIVPRTRLSAIGDRSFRVTVAQAWNSLPTDVTASTSLPSFNRQLKTFFIYQIFPITLNCFLIFVYRVLEAT